ncbi:MAG: hypothetical protein L0338_13695 [Acidobacteria bacterium]|nr:hypothetical protein [Acidobacteriota bacterium]
MVLEGIARREDVERIDASKRDVERRLHRRVRPVRPRHERSLLVGVVRGVEHERPIEAANT